MFVSIFVVLNADTSTGLSVSSFYRSGNEIELRSAVTSHFPNSVPAHVPINIFQEGKAVHLLTSEVLKVT